MRRKHRRRLGRCRSCGAGSGGTGGTFSSRRRTAMCDEEAAFQAALDPDDWTARLVFADWLEERGDPRAEGHRVIVAAHFNPEKFYGIPHGHEWTWWRAYHVHCPAPESLPADWW